MCWCQHTSTVNIRFNPSVNILYNHILLVFGGKKCKVLLCIVYIISAKKLYLIKVNNKFKWALGTSGTSSFLLLPQCWVRHFDFHSIRQPMSYLHPSHYHPSLFWFQPSWTFRISIYCAFVKMASVLLFLNAQAKAFYDLIKYQKCLPFKISFASSLSLTCTHI